VHVEVWWEILKEKGKFKNLGAERRVILKFILRKYFEITWTGLIWLTVRTISMLLWTRQ
jgi:hypothetical protein